MSCLSTRILREIFIQEHCCGSQSFITAITKGRHFESLRFMFFHPLSPESLLINPPPFLTQLLRIVVQYSCSVGHLSWLKFSVFISPGKFWIPVTSKRQRTHPSTYCPSHLSQSHNLMLHSHNEYVQFYICLQGQGRRAATERHLASSGSFGDRQFTWTPSSYLLRDGSLVATKQKSATHIQQSTARKKWIPRARSDCSHCRTVWCRNFIRVM
jgi:hypothetical protein